jgi:hypothetical protein
MSQTLTPLVLKTLILLLERGQIAKVVEILKTQLNDQEKEEYESNNK